MKNKDFFKTDFKYQDEISHLYGREARRYQALHNSANPGRHIWRHILSSRTFYFLVGGRHVSVSVELVRFRYAGTNSTFTFYGSIFLAFTRFSCSFVQAALKDPSPRGDAASCIHPSTLKRWARLPGFREELSHPATT